MKKYVVVWGTDQLVLEGAMDHLKINGDRLADRDKCLCIAYYLGVPDKELESLADSIVLLDSADAVEAYNWEALDATLRGLVVQANPRWSDEENLGIEWVRDTLRRRYRVTLPVVFVSVESRDDITIRGPHWQIVNTFGLGHALWTPLGGIDYPSDYEGARPRSPFAFLDNRPRLNPLQFQDLMYYCDDSLMFSRLKHDFPYNPMGSVESLLSLLDGYCDENAQRLRADVKSLIGRMSPLDDTERLSLATEASMLFERGMLLDSAETKAPELCNHGDRIEVLLLDDHSESLVPFINYAKSNGVDITAVSTVNAAITKLERNGRYGVVICDLRLVDKQGLLLESQGYDLLRVLHLMPQSYGVIVLSTLPRNFKLALAQYSLLDFRNFGNRENLGMHRYQRELLELVLEEHDAASRRRLTRGIDDDEIRSVYLYWRQSTYYRLGRELVDRRAENCIRQFLEGFKFPEEASGSNEKDWIKKLCSGNGKNNLTGAIAPVKYSNHNEEADGILKELWTSINKRPLNRESKSVLERKGEKGMSLYVDCIPEYVCKVNKEHCIFLDYQRVKPFCDGAAGWLSDFLSFVRFYRAECDMVLGDIRSQLHFSRLRRVSQRLHHFASGGRWDDNNDGKGKKLVEGWSSTFRGTKGKEFENLTTLERWAMVSDFVKYVGDCDTPPKSKKECQLYENASELFEELCGAIKEIMECKPAELSDWNPDGEKDAVMSFARYVDAIADASERGRRLEVIERMAEERKGRNFKLEDFEDRLVMRRLALLLCQMVSKSNAHSEWDKRVNNILQNGLWSNEKPGNKPLQSSYWVRWSDADGDMMNVCTDEEREFFEHLLSDEKMRELTENFIDNINAKYNG